MLDTLAPDTGYMAILAINLAVAFLMIILVRTLSSVLSGVNAKQELAEKDNPAFGIALSGTVFAVTVMMTGVVYGAASETYMQEVMAVLGYGVAGLLLMTLTHIVFDRFLLPQVSVKQMILDGNCAAALADAGNVIASALIIRAVLIWSYGNDITPWIAVPAGYVLSQAVMSAISAAAVMKLKRALEKDASVTGNLSVIERALQEQNVAVALRFAGMRIGGAFAVTGASGMIFYSAGAALQTACLWVALSLVFLTLIWLLVKVTDFVLLAGIDVDDETINQHNVGVGALQCIIIVSIGMIVAALAH